MALWLPILLQAVQTVLPPAPFDLATLERTPTATALPRCDNEGPKDEIVVCGQRHDDRYRLPLPVERSAPATRVRGEAQTGMAVLTPAQPCGMFLEERRCSKREKADYGYGKGRDPVTVLTRLARTAIDPDAD
jgi:hypothetical protein